MVRLTDPSDMTIIVYRGRKTTTQQQLKLSVKSPCLKLQVSTLDFIICLVKTREGSIMAVEKRKNFLKVLIIYIWSPDYSMLV